MKTDNKDNNGIRLRNTADKVAALNSTSLIQLLEAAYELRKALQEGRPGAQGSITEQEPVMMILLEYLILNEDNPNLDPKIFQFLEKFFGKKLKKKKNKLKEDEEKDVEEEEEEELEQKTDDLLTKERKKIKARMAIYQIYKITNPERLAGETDVDNFIKNVKTRGIDVAMKYEGSKLAKNFTAKEINNMESYRGAVREGIRNTGSRGGGL
jgi:hypothetical protein